MNDYRLLNAVSVHLSSFELEQLLELELAKLEPNGCANDHRCPSATRFSACVRI